VETEASWSPRVYPATIGQFRTKQLKCQIAALRDPANKPNAPILPGWHSQFRGAAKARGWRFGRGPDGPIQALTSPDYAAVAAHSIAPIKPAPIAGHIWAGNQDRSATLAMA